MNDHITNTAKKYFLSRLPPDITADDFLQSVRLKIHKYPFNPNRGTEATYVYMIAQTVWNDIWRASPHSLMSVPLTEENGPLISPETLTIEATIADILENSPEEKRLIYGCILDGLTYVEMMRRGFKRPEYQQAREEVKAILLARIRAYNQ